MRLLDLHVFVALLSALAAYVPPLDLHVFVALLSALAAYVPPQGGDQAVLVGVVDAKTLLEQVIDVSRGGLPRPAAAGETGTHLVGREGDDGSVVASARPEEGHPTPSARARLASVRDHDEADDRPSRACSSRSCARKEGSTRWERRRAGGESTRGRTREPTHEGRRPQQSRRFCCCLRRQPASVHAAGRETSTLVIYLSTCPLQLLASSGAAEVRWIPVSTQVL